MHLTPAESGLFGAVACCSSALTELYFRKFLVVVYFWKRILIGLPSKNFLPGKVVVPSLMSCIIDWVD